MPLIVSVLAQAALFALLFVASLVITVVPDGRDALQQAQIVLAGLTGLSLLASVVLVVLYAKDRDRSLFQSSRALVASFLMTGVLGLFTAFGVLF